MPEHDDVLQPDMEPVDKPAEDELAHDDSHHHHEPIPPPSPDVLVGLSLFAWGFGTFLAVVLSILVLDGYFWKERGAETAGQRITQSSLIGDGLQVLRQNEAAHLGTYKKLEGDRYQIPIEQAKALIVRDLGAGQK